MTDTNHRHTVDQALQALAARLYVLIPEKLAEVLGGLEWTAILTELDRVKGRTPSVYSANDVAAQLRVLTERLGGIGYPFSVGNRLVGNYAGELRIARNNWAHLGDFNAVEAWRVVDTAQRLLAALGDAEGAESFALLAKESLAAAAQESGGTPMRGVDQMEQGSENTIGRSASGGLAPLALAEASQASETAHYVASRASRTAATSSAIGTDRPTYEPWELPSGADPQVIHDLPKKAAKEQVRAVAAEIVEFEGPVHIERVARLVAWSFGVGKVHARPLKQIVYQIRQGEQLIDQDDFVWPQAIDPATWQEFRPNGPDVERDLELISPVEIVNAMRWVVECVHGHDDEQVDRAVLAIFGRRRMTAAAARCLARARRVYGTRS